MPEELDRKMWLDYIIKVNDRMAQSTQPSGATSWALAAVAAAILYRETPIAGTFLAMPQRGIWYIALFLFQLDFLWFFVSGLIQGTEYAKPELRVMPDAQRPSQFFSVLSTGGWTALLGSSHLYLASQTAFTHFQRFSLLAFGLFWAGETLAKTKLITKRHVLFSVPAVVERLGVLFAIFSIPALIFALFSLVSVSRTLASMPEGWLRPFGVSAEFVLVISITFFLLIRFVNRNATAMLSKLERDILLEELNPSEIRSRFVDAVVGLRVAEWLQRFRKISTLLEEHVAGLTVISKSDQQRDVLECRVDNIRNELRVVEQDFLIFSEMTNRKGMLWLLLTKEERELISDTEGTITREWIADQKQLIRDAVHPSKKMAAETSK